MACLRIGAVLVCLGLGGVLRAELHWLQRRILIEPPAGAPEASGEFEFVNRGKTPVRVTEVRSGCGCTVMALEKDVVPPGEKGKIRAVFHVGSRQGRQSVAVTVTTSEPETRIYELTVEAEIKEFVSLTPRLHYWKVGDEPKPKIFQVTLMANYRFLGAESATPDFAVEVIGQENRVVQLRASPRDTWARRDGVFKIKLSQEGRAPVEVLAYVRVL